MEYGVVVLDQIRDLVKPGGDVVPLGDHGPAGPVRLDGRIDDDANLVDFADLGTVWTIHRPFVPSAPTNR